MDITKLSLKRPVSTLMFYTAILLLGIISLIKTPKDLLPKINYPQITIATKYLSAAPAEIENLVTIPIEETIATVEGIQTISSVSKEGLSLIYADFSWGSDPGRAVLDIRQKIDSIKEKLPEEAEQSLIKKMNPFARPMMEINFAADQNSEKTLFYINKFIKDRINKTEGVALVKVSGGREKHIFVDVDANRLKAHNIDTKSICDAIKNTNLNYPAGNVKSEYYDYIIRTEGRFKTLKDIENTLVFINTKHNKDNKRIDTIKIKDIASVYEDYPSLKSISRLNQNPTIMLSIYKQSDANTIDTANRVKQTLKELNILTQKNITYKITYDKSIFIKQSSDSTAVAGILGAVLAFAALLFFLRSYLTAAVAFISLPISIFACFIFMFFYGITLNLISLAGIALAIGMLVDNAIVVLENIKRTVDTKKNHSKKTIAEGTKQVSFALIAATLTTVSVFMPLLFLKGLLGALFNSLALVVTFALIASLIISITLIPRLYLNAKKIKADRKLHKAKAYTDFISSKYEFLLNASINNPKKIFRVVITLSIVSVLILYFIPKQLMPDINEGNFLIQVEMPQSSSIENTDKQVKALEEILSYEKNILATSVQIGSKENNETLLNLSPAQAQITIKVKKLSDRYIDRLSEKLKKVLFRNTEIRYEKISPMQAVSSENFDFKIMLTSFHNTKQLVDAAEKIKGKLSTEPMIKSIRHDIPKLAMENNIKINKEKAAIRDINSEYISNTLYTALKGVTASEMNRAGRKIPIVVRLSTKDRINMNKVQHLPLKINEQDTILLKDVASFKQTMSPGEIKRKNGLKTIELKIKTKKRFSAKHMKKILTDNLKHLKINTDIDIKMIPKNAENKSAYRNLIFMFTLALFLIYMIMSAQFESFKNPLLIMLTVPLSIIGVAFGLLIFGKTLNIISLLGIIILCGIAVNNGIILIECIEKSIKENPQENIKKTVADAAMMRLRPILITATTTISGLLPMLISAEGTGAIKSTLAVTLTFGLIATTVLTLFILPVVYIKTQKTNTEKS